MRSDWDAIEFTKTRGWESRDRQDDEFDEYDGLLTWSVRRGTISALQARALRRQAAARPDQARAAIEDARSLRALAYGILRNAGRAKDPTREELRRVTDWVQRFAGARSLTATAEGVQWIWTLDPYRLDHPLAPVAWSLGELLTAEEFARVRVCDADDCGWLFVDVSRGRTRRWCDAAECGNLTRVRRFRARRKG